MRLQEEEGEQAEQTEPMEWGDATDNEYYEDLETTLFIYNLSAAVLSAGMLALHWIFALALGSYSYSGLINLAIKKYSPTAVTWVITLFTSNPIAVFANLAMMSYTSASGPDFWEEAGFSFGENYWITNSEAGTGFYDALFYVNFIMKVCIAAGLNFGQALLLPQIQALTYRLANHYDKIVELGFADFEEEIGMGESEESTDDAEAETDESF